MLDKIFQSTLVLLLSTSSLLAFDTKFSGFATIGGAISDKEYTYQKYINNHGTLRKDTLAGAQLDVSIADQWGATFQGKVAQSLKDDTNFDPTLTWGFLSYRPTNDWFIRVGKLRVPFYLNSQNEDIGVTYDFARLPLEVYTLAAYDNGLGAIVTKSFDIYDGSLSVDAFYIKMDYQGRSYKPVVGAKFTSLDVDLQGLSILYETSEGARIRGGFYSAKSKEADADVITLGVDYSFADGYRVISEYVMLDVKKYEQLQAGYISLLKSIGDWTPYITYGVSVPNDTGEQSYSIGSSYHITPLQKLKAEVMHVEVGATPYSLIDITSTTNLYANEKLNVFSFSYNVAF